MSEEEINQIIAEYMELGNVLISDVGIYCAVEDLNLYAGKGYIQDLYTESLDALVPVIEKLNLAASFYFSTEDGDNESKWVAAIDIKKPISCKACGKISCEVASDNAESLSLALATVCAKAIKELSQD